MKRLPLCLLLLLSAFLPAAVARAQDGGESGERLALRLNRDFGYSLGSQMQGRFSYQVNAPDDVVRVDFLLDGERLGSDSQRPFRFAFNTGDHATAWHTLSAVGYTADGRALPSNQLRRRFVPAGMVTLFVGVVFALVAGSILVRYFLSRGDATRRYGLRGGAICPHCGRPFPLHLWSINLLAGRIDRCPHCRKWAFQRRANDRALAAAEQDWLEEVGSAVDAPTLSREARLRRRLDESRYE